MARDTRLDLARGFAMVTIAINHTSAMFMALGMKGPAIPTLTSFSYSSAAELFFLLSGYMVGLIYFRRDDIILKLLKRSGKIYLYNLLAFLLAIPLAYWGGEALMAATGADHTVDAPLVGTVQFMLLRQHPDLLGVLSLYVLLMLLAPVFVPLLRRMGTAFLIPVALIYAAVQFVPGLNLPGGTPGEDGLWNFNPFAWQFLFFAGMVAGKNRLHEAMFRLLDAHRGAAWALLGLLVITMAIRFADKHSGFDAPWTDKTNLEPVRMLHALVVVGGLASAFTLLKPFLDLAPFRWLALNGRHTLQCYVASIIATYAAAAFAARTGASLYPMYLSACVTILAVITATAYWMDNKGAFRLTRLASNPKSSIGG
jgi:hypothetical protein